MTKTYLKDKLKIIVCDDRRMLGSAAGTMAAEKIRSLLAEKQTINVIFAAAPSQNEFLAYLVGEPSIAWERINAFHMDEYLGITAGAPQSFGAFLLRAIVSKVGFRSVNYLDGSTADAGGECARYSKLLTDNPPDIVFMGIGENTHLAFNDPPVADFDDPFLVKQVALDPACRQQQLNDGCFAALQDVPRFALTLTIPALLRAPSIFCMVPGKTKAVAVSQTLSCAVSSRYPSTALRMHTNSLLFVDAESFRLSQKLLS